MVNRRTGIVGGVVGLLGVAAATGAIVADRRVAKQRRALAGQNPEGFDALPVDRAGSVAADDGIALYYEEVGPEDAPLTVVFVHGFALRLGAFHYQRQALQERYGNRVRLVFYDQRGHGRSARTDAEHSTVDQLGRDLYTVLRNLVAHGPMVLVGHSMGGMTVMALADEHPELFTARRRQRPRVVAVALLSTSSGKLATVTLGLPSLLARVGGPLLPVLLRGAARQSALVERGKLVGTDLAWLIIRRMSFASSDVDPARVEYLTTIISGTRMEAIADFYTTLIDHDKLDALGVLSDIPVLIMCGEQDLITPPEHSQALADALPKAEAVIVPNAGHVGILEQPDVFDEALIRLIDTATSGRRR